MNHVIACCSLNIRLHRREEILVTKLIGATNGFVRRPFLYCGIWYGVLGAVIAWVVVETGFLLLSEPVASLAGLYQSDFQLETLPFQLLWVLLSGGICLGLLGSWLAVGQGCSGERPPTLPTPLQMQWQWRSG